MCLPSPAVTTLIDVTVSVELGDASLAGLPLLLRYSKSWSARYGEFPRGQLIAYESTLEDDEDFYAVGREDSGVELSVACSWPSDRTSANCSVVDLPSDASVSGIGSRVITSKSVGSVSASFPLSC